MKKLKKIENKWDNFIENPEIFIRGYVFGLIVGMCSVAILGLTIL